MPNTIQTDFANRLRWLLGDRRQYAWGNDIGASRGSTSRMFNGEIPGWEILLAIQEVERINLNWLLNGQGTPFLVLDTLPEQAACDGYRGYQLRSGDRHCLVLRRGAHRLTRNKTVQYEEFHVIAHPGDGDLEKIVESSEYREAPAPLFHQLISGELGNLELQSWLNGQESSEQAYSYAPPALLKVAEPTPDNFIRNLARLNEDERRRVRELIGELLAQRNESWEEGY